ncbi:replication-associated recombination protein A [Mycoplasma miroungirhinis]|uniref:Replication-associated recombination protein A n=1 Tax=Mycoplasma miroungirhinis TaxID=754516 RepID=A0A6M4JAU1_9MOLU|nr:replication-associated recombination protein A [Mycoplasma miroungirhinis]QJR44114.1 replication-associated recombination protein A [Mycoplasma miroungirhinis]
MNLATLLRPKKIDDLLLNDELKKLFNKIITFQDFRSLIFYGPPGTGKSTIAFILATELSKTTNFGYFNAATDNKHKLMKLIETNKIIIIDEIHRLNKDKQDILLLYLENSLITIYATTTENPFFKINPALRSRTNIFELTKPSMEDMSNYLKFLNEKFQLIKINDLRIYDFLASSSTADFRIAINNLDLLQKLYSDQEITLEQIKKILPSVNLIVDKDGDEHYNLLSAFHKSLRGSDANAALYYGYLLFKAQQYDAMFRRMLCASYEDIGLANPIIATQTLNAIESFERLGFAEGYLPIAFAILNIALSPKSNSAYLAFNNVKNFIEKGNVYDVPNFLKDAHYKSAQKLNRGIDYKYPHDFKNSYYHISYLPKEIMNQNFYIPKNQGYEEKIKIYWENIKNKE